MLAAAPPAPPSPSASATTQIDQLAPDKTSATQQIEADRKPERAADVAQLPDTASAADDSSGEDQLLAARISGSRGTSAEIARAFEIIRGRGQVPTAELLAREIGPDALQAYLEANPGAVPDAVKPPEPTIPDDVKGSPGTLIIPPKG
jgi:hypothetical protein